MDPRDVSKTADGKTLLARWVRDRSWHGQGPKLREHQGTAEHSTARGDLGPPQTPPDAPSRPQPTTTSPSGSPQSRPTGVGVGGVASRLPEVLAPGPPPAPGVLFMECDLGHLLPQPQVSAATSSLPAPGPHAGCLSTSLRGPTSASNAPQARTLQAPPTPAHGSPHSGSPALDPAPPSPGRPALARHLASRPCCPTRCVSQTLSCLHIPVLSTTRGKADSQLGTQGSPMPPRQLLHSAPW